MTVIFMDFSDHMPEKSDPIAHNGKQNVLVYHILQNLLKFLQGVLGCTCLSSVQSMNYVDLHEFLFTSFSHKISC